MGYMACSQPAPACGARKVAEQRTPSSYESRIPPSFAAKPMQECTNAIRGECILPNTIQDCCTLSRVSRGGILHRLNYGLDYRPHEMILLAHGQLVEMGRFIFLFS